MLLPIWLIYIAAALRMLGGLAYLRATWIGRARPNPLSWLLWGTTPMIAFFAELSANVGPAVIVTLALALSPLMVFVVAMIKRPGSLKFDRFNITCALIALTGIALWLITDNPLLAIILAITADIASSMPTIKKTKLNPKTEFAPTYAVSALAMIITLLTVQSFNFATVAFPSYVLIINIYIVYLITKRRKKSPVKRRKAAKTLKKTSKPRIPQRALT